MSTTRITVRRRTAVPTGHTLIELVASMTAATALMAGMGGTIYIASQALDDGGSNAVQKVEDASLLGDLMREAKYALSFSEMTDKAVTFNVPDRDGDSLPETIRYAWSGTPGDPLTYEYNGSSLEVIAEEVQHFKLGALTRFMAAPVIPPEEGGGNLLFVSGGKVLIQISSGELLVLPTTQEQIRIDLIESWGYTVTVMGVTGVPLRYQLKGELLQ